MVLESHSEREVLERLYVLEGLSIPKIGAVLGRRKEWVLGRLRKHGIPVRTRAEAAALRTHSPETRQKMSVDRKGKTSGAKGSTWSAERHEKHKALWKDPAGLCT